MYRWEHMSITLTPKSTTAIIHKMRWAVAAKHWDWNTLSAVNNKLAFLYLLLSPLPVSPLLLWGGGLAGEQGLWVLKWLLLCDVYSGLRIRATNYTVRDTSMWDEEEEKLQMFTIEHLQWLVIQEAWLLLLKCGPESIRAIIRVVRAN